MLPRAKSTTRIDHSVNPQNPATWLRPDEPLVGADGRDYSWCYAWFKPIPSSSGCYCAGADGTIWSLRLKWRRIGHYVSRYGYVCVRIQRRWKRVPRLVLEAFVGPCPEGMQACHGNGCKLNNALSNLRWDTAANNSADRVAHGTLARGSRVARSKLSEANVVAIRRMVAEGKSKASVARTFNVTRTQIINIVSRRHWSHVE